MSWNHLVQSRCSENHFTHTYLAIIASATIWLRCVLWFFSLRVWEMYKKEFSQRESKPKHNTITRACIVRTQTHQHIYMHTFTYVCIPMSALRRVVRPMICVLKEGLSPADSRSLAYFSQSRGAHCEPAHSPLLVYIYILRSIARRSCIYMYIVDIAYEYMRGECAWLRGASECVCVWVCTRNSHHVNENAYICECIFVANNVVVARLVGLICNNTNNKNNTGRVHFERRDLCAALCARRVSSAFHFIFQLMIVWVSAPFSAMSEFILCIYIN